MVDTYHGNGAVRSRPTSLSRGPGTQRGVLGEVSATKPGVKVSRLAKAIVARKAVSDGQQAAPKPQGKGIYERFIEKKSAEIHAKAEGLTLPSIAGSPDVLGMYGLLVENVAVSTTEKPAKSRIDSLWKNAIMERMPSHGGRMSINLALARSSKTILMICARNLNWIEREKDESNASVYWCVTPEEVEAKILQRKPNQRVSRIPGMYILCNKVKFAELFRLMQKIQPGRFDFVPHTVIVPTDPDQDVLQVLSKGYGILKPDEGTQGDGIYLVNSLDEIKRRMACIHVEAAVLQSYIKKPMLLDGHKFDLRVYVVVLSLTPLRVFLCHEGLVRVCSIAYEQPNKANTHRSAGHLTNYTLNKTNQMFEHSDDPNDGTRGTKRNLQATLEYLERQGRSRESMWSQIELVCRDTIEAMADAVKGKVPGFDRSKLWPLGVRRTAKMSGCKTPYGSDTWGEWERDCFHILGFDIMFDHKCKAWLLEVNCNPSMAIDTIYPNTVPPGIPCVGPELLAVIDEAKNHVRGKGVRECKCTQHHRAHLHLPSSIDLAAKHTCVNGALSMLHRDYVARKAGGLASAEALREGLRFDVLVDRAGEDEEDVAAVAPPGGARPGGAMVARAGGAMGEEEGPSTGLGGMTVVGSSKRVRGMSFDSEASRLTSGDSRQRSIDSNAALTSYDSAGSSDEVCRVGQVMLVDTEALGRSTAGYASEPVTP